jgi:hypothetical protein
MSARRPDTYAVLGLRRGASQAEITHAYRALLRRHHPDTRREEADASTDSDAELGQVIAAYAQLRHADPADPAAAGPAAGPASARAGVSHDASRGPAAERSPIRAGPVRWQASPADEPLQPDGEALLGDDVLSAALRWLRR